jgi:hypothetical protein
MAATTEEETKMRRRKRFTIKFVALGFAVSALLAAPAQARVDEGLGMPKQSEPTLQLGADDRSLARMSTPTLEPNVVVSPDDRAVSRISPATLNQSHTVTSTSSDGYEIVDFGVGGIVLLLGAATIVVAARHMYNGRLASV